MNNRILLSIVVASVVLTACKSTPKIRTAIEKNYEVAGDKFSFGGSYNEDENQLTITVNGDPSMRGRFAPYTPKLNMSNKHKNVTISSQCYFGSILGSEGGAFGAIAGAIQGSKNKSGDKCQILVDGKTAETLFF